MSKASSWSINLECGPCNTWVVSTGKDFQNSGQVLGGDCLCFGNFFTPSKRKEKKKEKGSPPFKYCTGRYFQYENMKLEDYTKKRNKW